MLRKNIRLRRQYLFTLQRENAEKEKMQKKLTIQESEAANKKMPTQLYKEADKLRKELASNDANNIIPRTHIDDEYGSSQYVDPTLLVTTCRNPSSRLLQFQKEVAVLFPNAKRINRGGYVLEDLVNLCQTKGLTDMVILHQHRGEPDGMIVCHFPLGPTAYFGLQNVVLRHDVDQKVQAISQAYPHLIFNNFSTPLGQRVCNILKHLFPVPKVDSKRVITFSNKDDLVSMRHHTFQKQSHKEVNLKQIGPRFQMKLYQIMLGLINQKQATKQWVLRPYMNTATKRKAL